MPRRRILIAALAIAALLALPATSGAYLLGIADQSAAMFTSPLYKQLIKPQHASHRISRYIAPYDIASGKAANAPDLAPFRAWYSAALADHVQVMVAFYHSNVTPTSMPSVTTYRRDVQRFIKRFPHIHVYQPWNESNRGDVPHLFDSPHASQAAQYYLALAKVCRHCTIAGLDVLDSPDVRPTITYIQEFQADVRRAHGKLPTIWGLHNYSDTNRTSSSRTRAVLAAVKGQVWLTETGGVVQEGASFPNIDGEGLTRAARALTYMFKLANISKRITRLYIFQWTGSNADARFDAGLTDVNGQPRPGYYVVCAHMLHNAAVCRPPGTSQTRR